MQAYEPNPTASSTTSALDHKPASQVLRLVAHEIQAPLTRLKGYVELLQSELFRGSISPELVERTLERMNRSVDSAAELVKGFSSSGISLKRSPASRQRQVDLWRLVAEVALHYPEVSRVEIDTPGTVDGEPLQLERVLINLLENARKYSPSGTGVRVFLRPSRDGTLLQVEDQGIGLPPGTTEAIFELYDRASNARVQRIPGHGIGLYICRQIVQEHGGRIWAESEGEGHGTTINVWLPPSSLSVTHHSS